MASRTACGYRSRSKSCSPPSRCNRSPVLRCNHSVQRFPPANPAFETFVRETGAGLLRFAHVLTLDRARAEDLAQETYIRVGLAWSRVRADGNAIGYAQRTMVNVFLNERRRRSEVPVGVVPEVGSEDDRLAAIEAFSSVRGLLAALPPKQRAAVALRYLADMSDDQIGEILGCSPQTVRSQVSRGLATLRRPSTQEGDSDA